MKRTRARFLSLLALSAAVWMAAPQTSFAMGQKPPEEAPANTSGVQNLAPLQNAIQEFNQANSRPVALNEGLESAIFYSIHQSNGSCTTEVYEEIKKKDLSGYAPEMRSLCQKVEPLLSAQTTCADFVQLQYEKASGTATVFYSTGCRVDEAYTIRFYATLTPKAQQLVKSGAFYSSSNMDVEYNVRAIQTALGNLVLLPRQRKALDGFFNATDTFAKSIDTEKAKAAKGQEAMPLTHRSFAEKASLLVAYYRYLKDDFAELAQFGSANGGTFKANQDAVRVIDSAITNITKDYGLDTDVTTKQVADYGRVLLDLMNNFSLSLTTAERAKLQPVMVELVTQVIPTSEAFGDVGAHDAVVAFKNLWEAPAFQDFLTEKLSVSDDKSTTLILNMSAATYKIGLSANVDIKTFDARDADRIKNQKTK